MFTSVYRSVCQYAYINTIGMGVVTLKDIQSHVGTEAISLVVFLVCCLFYMFMAPCRQLLHALLFTKSSFFVNPAHASPNLFVAELGHLKLKDLLSVAVCIMTGIITECAIVSEGFSGLPDNVKTVHKVLLPPFCQDFHRNTTCRVQSWNFIPCLVPFLLKVCRSQ